MLIRIRSKEGNFRFELQPEDDISVLLAKILETDASIDPASVALSSTPRDGQTLVSAIAGTFGSLGITHGDLLFATYTAISAAAAPVPAPVESVATASTLSGKVIPLEAPISSASNPNATAVPSTTAPRNAGKKPWEEVTQDEIDTYWDGQDGKILRKKGGDLCKCGEKSMCDYCMPVEPFDAAYQASHAIKHLSAHAHLQKLHSSSPLSSATSFIPPLAPLSYRVSVPCSSGSHPSWPLGICTKCQPSPITLSRQLYRSVDHIEFANRGLIDDLLSFWRKTGMQRFGYLLGHWDKYEEVPMGIKGVVEAIHEPPQEGLRDGLTVGFPWEDEARIEGLAKGMGMSVIGMVYTDLTAELDDKGAPSASGKVVHKRHADSYFLSSLEVIFSASLQRLRPSPSRFSSTGYFGSKFVTCVLSGDAEGGIAIEAYQVSEQAVAMVEADMIEASVEPGTVRVNEETVGGKGGEGRRYVPEVFFRYKNEYGIEVKESAKPCFPVEYLLVNVTNGFPKSPNPIFKSPSPFPSSNRTGLEDQTMAKVAISYASIAKGGDAALGTWLSDWHLVVFLQSCGIFDSEDMKLISKISTTQDQPSISLLTLSPNWQTFLAITSSEQPNPPPRSYPGGADESFGDGFEIPPDVDVPPESGDVDMDGGGGGGGGGGRVCPHCTFENEGNGADCDICGLPLSG